MNLNITSQAQFKVQSKQKKQPTGKKTAKGKNKVRRRHMYLNTLEEILPELQTNSD
jgi:hypothetical protein